MSLAVCRKSIDVPKLKHTLPQNKRCHRYMHETTLFELVCDP